MLSSLLLLLLLDDLLWCLLFFFFFWDSSCVENTLISGIMYKVFQCYGSGIFIPDPDFYQSRIPDLGSRIQKQQHKRGEKKIRCQTFLCSHKFHKIEHYFSFEVVKKKIWANFQRIIELFTQKLFTKLSKIWIWDPGPGSEIWGPEKTYSGSRIQGSKRHRIPNPGSGILTRIEE